MVALVVVLVVGVVVGLALWFASKYTARQAAMWRAFAARHGLRVDVERKGPPPIDFDLFDLGRSRGVQPQFWAPGQQDSVFQYQYTVSSGDNSTTHRVTAALIAVPFHGPHLTISTENWLTRAKRMVGVRDIEVESPPFNDRYHVRCDDERFAITLLDPPMIAWLLSPGSGLGTVNFEFIDGWMLCSGKRLPLEQLPQMLTWSQSVRAQLPAVLTDLYPGRPGHP